MSEPAATSAVPPMRVAVVIESFNPAAGGNERSTDQIVRELVTRGHEVTLITGACPEHARPEGVDVRAMGTRKSSSVFRLMRFIRWANRELEQGAFDTSLSVTMAVPAKVMQPRGGTVRETLQRNIAMRGGGWKSQRKRIEVQFDPKQQLLLAMERRTLNSEAVYRVVALSQYVVGQLELHYGFPAERTVVIPNAAVMPDADAAQRTAWRTALRQAYRIDESDVVYLFAAQNPSLKGLPTLLRALPRVLESGVPAVALLAGGIGFGDHESVARVGLRDAVRIIGPTRQMPALFAASDVTVLPSWYDPSSKVVLESLMMGTPAISTTYNGASDHLEPGDGPPRGCVIDDPSDDVQLAEAMQRLADPAFRAACSAACEGLADQLSMRRHVDALEAVLYESAQAGQM